MQTCGRALCCVRSGELRLRSSVWNVRRKLDGPPRGGSATLPTPHLCFQPDTPPGICFLLLLFYRKSHWERMRRLSSRSAALLFRRALVSWLTAHPVCARRRSCSAYQRGAAAVWDVNLKKEGQLWPPADEQHELFTCYHEMCSLGVIRAQNNMNGRRAATRLFLTLQWKGRNLSLNKIWKSRNGCVLCPSFTPPVAI